MDVYAVMVLSTITFAGGGKIMDGFFVGVQSGIWAEEMRLSITSGDHVEKQNYWRNSVIVGVRLKPGVALSNNAQITLIPSLGIGSVFYTGDGLIRIGLEGNIELANKSSFVFSAGLLLHVNINFSRPYLSASGVLIPLSASWRRLRITYAPGLLLPMGKNEEKVFAGSKTQKARVAFTPLSFGLHIRVGQFAQ